MSGTRWRPATLREAISDAQAVPPVDGVTVLPIGEDCDQIIAAGHLDRDAMLAACEPLARFYYGNTLADWLADLDRAEVVPEHRYAVLRMTEDEDDKFPWYCTWVDAETPGAEPITVLDVS